MSMKPNGGKRFVIAIGVKAVVFLLSRRLGLLPVLERQRWLDRVVVQKERELLERRSMCNTYLSRQGLMEAVNRRLARLEQEVRDGFGSRETGTLCRREGSPYCYGACSCGYQSTLSGSVAKSPSDLVRVSAPH
jgi:hypothetical protein